MRESNRTSALALGISPTAVSERRRPGSTRIPDEVRERIKAATGTTREIAAQFDVSPMSVVRYHQWYACAPLAILFV
jgi:hypothetical protein